jgi:hypothetical protein
VRRLVTTLVLATPPARASGPRPGYFATDNVEWLGNIPLNADSAGARLHDGYLYVTEDRGLTVYDVSDPALPLPVGFHPLPQQAYFTEEDVDTNGEILLIGSFGDLTDGVGPLNRVFVWTCATRPALPSARSSTVPPRRQQARRVARSPGTQRVPHRRLPPLPVRGARGTRGVRLRL